MTKITFMQAVLLSVIMHLLILIGALSLIPPTHRDTPFVAGIKAGIL